MFRRFLPENIVKNGYLSKSLFNNGYLSTSLTEKKTSQIEFEKRILDAKIFEIKDNVYVDNANTH